MTEDKIEWLDDTIFWSVFSPLFLECFRREVESFKPSGVPLKSISSNQNKKDQYLNDIYERLGLVSDTLEELKMIVSYMGLKGLDVFLKENKIERSSYIKFIHDSYLIKLVSMIDILAKLGFSVFNVSLSPYKMSGHYFINYPKTKNTKSAEELRNLIEIISVDRKNRNLVIHDGKYRNEHIENVWSTEIDPKIISSSLVKDYLDSKKQANETILIEEMNSNYKAVLECTIRFTNSLTSQLEINMK